VSDIIDIRVSQRVWYRSKNMQRRKNELGSAMPRFQRAALYVLTSGPTTLRGNDEFAGNVSFWATAEL
jgi:hypothetical protein